MEYPTTLFSSPTPEAFWRPAMRAVPWLSWQRVVPEMNWFWHDIRRLVLERAVTWLAANCCQCQWLALVVTDTVFGRHPIVPTAHTELPCRVESCERLQIQRR